MNCKFRIPRKVIQAICKELSHSLVYGAISLLTSVVLFFMEKFKLLGI